MNSLIYAMGDKADDVMRSFCLSAEDQKQYDVVKKKFDSFLVKQHVIYERAWFNQHKQEGLL